MHDGFNCCLCDATGMSFLDTEEHLAAHLEIAVYTCVRCEEEFFSAIKANQHALQCFKDNPYSARLITSNVVSLAGDRLMELERLINCSISGTPHATNRECSSDPSKEFYFTDRFLPSFLAAPSAANEINSAASSSMEPNTGMIASDQATSIYGRLEDLTLVKGPLAASNRWLYPASSLFDDHCAGNCLFLAEMWNKGSRSQEQAFL